MSDFNENTENSNSEQEEKKKLTDMQLRYVQVAAGIVSAAVLIFTLFFMEVLGQVNSLLQYSFLIVFLIITFGRRSIENKYRLRLNLFGLVLLDGIAAGILLFVLIRPMGIDPTIKLVVLIGGAALLLVLGVLVPFLRYRKRVENGTLPPIRVPEKKETEISGEQRDDGRLSRDEKIAEMMRELSERKNDEEK